MKHKVIKFLLDFVKEECWLNEMSAKGLQLVSVSYPQYVLEEGEQGEYIYRLELLEHWPSSVEGRAYLRFVEDSGTECVDTWWRWAYFRRKASEGSFDLYTDTTLKIKNYARIVTVAGVGAAVNAAFCIFYIGILHISPFLLAPSGLLALLLAGVTWVHWGRLRKLKEAGRVRE